MGPTLPCTHLDHHPSSKKPRSNPGVQALPGDCPGLCSRHWVPGKHPLPGIFSVFPKQTFLLTPSWYAPLLCLFSQCIHEDWEQEQRKLQVLPLLMKLWAGPEEKRRAPATLWSLSSRASGPWDHGLCENGHFSSVYFCVLSNSRFPGPCLATGRYLLSGLCLWGLGFPGGSVGKKSACSARDPGLIPGWGRSPGDGNGNPLQYSCLENSMDRHGVTKSWTRLSD